MHCHEANESSEFEGKKRHARPVAHILFFSSSQAKDLLFFRVLQVQKQTATQSSQKKTMKNTRNIYWTWDWMKRSGGEETKRTTNERNERKRKKKLYKQFQWCSAQKWNNCWTIGVKVNEKNSCQSWWRTKTEEIEKERMNKRKVCSWFRLQNFPFFASANSNCGHCRSICGGVGARVQDIHEMMKKPNRKWEKIVWTVTQKKRNRKMKRIADWKWGRFEIEMAKAFHALSLCY